MVVEKRIICCEKNLFHFFEIFRRKFELNMLITRTLLISDRFIKWLQDAHVHTHTPKHTHTFKYTDTHTHTETHIHTQI